MNYVIREMDKPFNDEPGEKWKRARNDRRVCGAKIGKQINEMMEWAKTDHTILFECVYL